MKKTVLVVSLLIAAPWTAHNVVAQDFGSVDLTSPRSVNIDRFGKPAFGLRAQREPELRRLREQAGRPVLQGIVELHDVDLQQLEGAMNKSTRRSKSAPDIRCFEEGGEIICKAE